MSNAPNEYRLVYLRHEFDDVDMYSRRNEREAPETVKTFTDWKPFTGGTIRVREANNVEFRYNQERM